MAEATDGSIPGDARPVQPTTRMGTRLVIGHAKAVTPFGAFLKSPFDRLPDLGEPRKNWLQIAATLRAEMKLGEPICDASPGDTARPFLNAERNLLRHHGWSFDPQTNCWNPPTKSEENPDHAFDGSIG